VVERRRSLGRIRLEPPWGTVPRTGIVAFDDLAGGAYLLRVDAGPAFEAVEVLITVPPGERAEVAIPLSFVR
jgi:hypothetical protein